MHCVWERIALHKKGALWSTVSSVLFTIVNTALTSCVSLSETSLPDSRMVLPSSWLDRVLARDSGRPTHLGVGICHIFERADDPIPWAHNQASWTDWLLCIGRDICWLPWPAGQLPASMLTPLTSGVGTLRCSGVPLTSRELESGLDRLCRDKGLRIGNSWTGCCLWLGKDRLLGVGMLRLGTVTLTLCTWVVGSALRWPLPGPAVGSRVYRLRQVGGLRVGPGVGPDLGADELGCTAEAAPDTSKPDPSLRIWKTGKTPWKFRSHQPSTTRVQPPQQKQKQNKSKIKQQKKGLIKWTSPLVPQPQKRLPVLCLIFHSPDWIAGIALPLWTSVWIH